MKAALRQIINKCALSKPSGHTTQARNQLGTPGGRRFFWEGSKVFKLCPTTFFQGWRKNFPGDWNPLASPLVTGLIPPINYWKWFESSLMFVCGVSLHSRNFTSAPLTLWYHLKMSRHNASCQTLTVILTYNASLSCSSACLPSRYLFCHNTQDAFNKIVTHISLHN